MIFKVLVNYLEVDSTAGFMGFINPRHSRAGSAQTKTFLHAGSASFKRTAVTGAQWLPAESLGIQTRLVRYKIYQIIKCLKGARENLAIIISFYISKNKRHYDKTPTGKWTHYFTYSLSYAKYKHHQRLRGFFRKIFLDRIMYFGLWEIFNRI